MKASCTIGSPPEMVSPPSSDAQRRRKLAEPIDHLLRRDVGAVLQMPGIGIVAVGAAQQAARQEQHDPQAGSVVAGGRLVGMDVAEGAFAVVAEARLRPARRARSRRADRAGCPPRGCRAVTSRVLRPQIWPWKVRLITSRCCSRRQPDEVDRIARHPDRELRILVRILHRVLERLLVDDVQVHVEAALVEIHVEGLDRARRSAPRRTGAPSAARPRRCS